jgi:hypothetical protein
MLFLSYALDIRHAAENREVNVFAASGMAASSRAMHHPVAQSH